MRAHQIMTRNAITVLPETPILEAAHKMLENHVSGLPVLDASGRTCRHRLGRRLFATLGDRHTAKASALAPVLSQPGSFCQ